MRVALRTELEVQRRHVPAPRVAARALTRPAAGEGKWPLQLRYAFIVGTTGLLWAAIYGVSLTLI